MNVGYKSAIGGRMLAGWPSVMPWVFVFLWSTGFIGAKFGLPYAEPFTFLLVRFALVTGLILVFALFTRSPWPQSMAGLFHAVVAGILLHAVFLGGVFASLRAGVPTGVSALIVGIQPLLTAILVGPLLGERVTSRQWLGFALGFCGVTLVVLRKLSFAGGDLHGLLFSCGALLGITAGTLYQKKYCAGLDMRSGAAIQYAAAGIAMFPLAYAFETMDIKWSGEFIFALVWLSIVLSVGAISLLYLMIRRKAAASVAGFFYMVPPLTALIGYFLFGETLDSLALCGMALAVFGVSLVNR